MKALFILYTSISLNFPAEKIDTGFFRTNFEAGIGTNKNLGLSLIKNADAKVNISTPFTPFITIGMSFQYDANYLFSIMGSLGYNAFDVGFDYTDNYNEIGFNVNDHYTLRSWISFIDITASKIFFINQNKMFSVGAGLSLTFQKYSEHGSAISATDTSNNFVWLFDMEYDNQRQLPGLSPKFLIEIEPFKIKNPDHQFLFFAQYNFSVNNLSIGEFLFYKGNSEYSKGTFTMENHYLTAGLKFRIGNL
jgi:hypothetical protein